MTMKATELEKRRGLKINNRLQAAGSSRRFGEGAAEQPDRREQRERDRALGLVPFACKLPADLAQQLQARATNHEGGLNALVADLLAQALKSQE